MEQLAFVDEHAIDLAVSRERAFRALTQVLGAGVAMSIPAPAGWVLGLSPRLAHGDWTAPTLEGNTLPGFEVSDARAPERLTLRGHHRFSTYELAFELDSRGDECTLRARTSAEFPGHAGCVYRSLVIGSGAHRILLRRMLRTIAARA
jgi:hypothetical protein